MQHRAADQHLGARQPARPQRGADPARDATSSSSTAAREGDRLQDAQDVGGALRARSDDLPGDDRLVQERPDRRREQPGDDPRRRAGRLDLQPALVLLGEERRDVREAAAERATAPTITTATRAPGHDDAAPRSPHGEEHRQQQRAGRDLDPRGRGQQRRRDARVVERDRERDDDHRRDDPVETAHRDRPEQHAGTPTTTTRRVVRAVRGSRRAGVPAAGTRARSRRARSPSAPTRSRTASRRRCRRARRRASAGSRRPGTPSRRTAPATGPRADRATSSSRYSSRSQNACAGIITRPTSASHACTRTKRDPDGGLRAAAGCGAGRPPRTWPGQGRAGGFQASPGA